MKENRHFILEEDGRSLKVVNGVVTSTSQPTPVNNSPIGWREAVVNWEWVPKKHGVARSFVTPFAFTNDEAKILRYAVYAESYERKLQFLIQRLTPEVDASFYRLIYRYLYRGEFDLSTFKDEGTQVRCGLMEGGLSKLLKANEGTAYEIPFDDDAITVKMRPIRFDQTAKFIMPDIEITQNQYIMPISFISQDSASSSQVAFFTSNYSPYFGGPTYNFEPSQNYFFYTPNAITIRVQGRIKVTSAGSYAFWITGASNTAINPLNYPSEPGLYYVQPAVAAGVHDFDLDVTIDVPAGEKLFFYALHPFSTLDTYSLTDITISYVFEHPATGIKAYKLLDLFKKLIEKITGNAADAESILLQLNAHIVLTCGDAIRGIEGAKIKTTLNEFFDFCDMVCFGGMSIDSGKIKIERRSRYYDYSNPIPLGAVKNCDITLANDIMGNKVKIGWPDPDIQDVNGKSAFNGTHNYSSVVTRIVKEISIECNYGADPYEIEIIRINLEGKNTTDNSSDNKNFGLNVEEDVSTYSPVAGSYDGVLFNFTGQAANVDQFTGSTMKITGTAFDGTYVISSAVVSGSDLLVTIVDPPAIAPGAIAAATITFPQYRLYRNTYDNENITDPADPDYFGVPSPTVFNIESFTPKRLAVKHGPWLRSLFYPFDTTKLKFEGTAKNQLLKTIASGVTVQENADINIYSLGDRLFLPFYFEFETEVPTDLIDLLEADTNRCFSFEWRGETYKGFPRKISQALNTDAPQKFKLLSSPDNDITKLIY
jgi:hypothetical protein